MSEPPAKRMRVGGEDHGGSASESSIERPTLETARAALAESDAVMNVGVGIQIKDFLDAGGKPQV
jgi:hypothetical protein